MTLACRAVLWPLLLAPLVAPASAADPPAQPDRLLAKLPGPSGTAAEFSRDGKFILTAGRDQARVWDAKTFELVTQPIKQVKSSWPLPSVVTANWW